MEPQWQPISMLSVFTDMIDTMLKSSHEQLTNIKLAIDKPHVLDDAILYRIIEQYSEQLEFQGLYKEQLVRWKLENLAEVQSVEVDRLTGQLPELKTNIENILKIARSIEYNTIDKITAMDDIELAEAMLTGKIKPPL